MREAAKFFGLNLAERIRRIFWRPIVKPGGKFTAKIKVVRDDQMPCVSLIPVNRNKQAAQMQLDMLAVTSKVEGPDRETQVSRISKAV